MTKPTHPITPDNLRDEIEVALLNAWDQDVTIRQLAEAVADHLRPTVEMAESEEARV